MRKDVVISCVAENKDDHLVKVVNLCKSIRYLAGSLSSARLIVNFINGVSKEIRKKLENIQVEVRIVKRFDRRRSTSNKLRAFELEDSFEYLIYLDVDTVVVRDFSEHLKADYLGACLPQMSPFTMEQWENFFKFYQLDMPEERYHTISSDDTIVPYFNSGVLIIPLKYIKPLRKYWGEYIVQNINNKRQLKERNIYSRMDQVNLALTIQKAKIPVNILPVSMNFPSLGHILDRLNPVQIDPYILHYHNQITENGLLKPCRDSLPLLKAAITRVNNVITTEN